MKIPADALEPETLQQIIEAFVLREGTDYGRDYTLEEKCAAVRDQLDRGVAELQFDPETETIDIRPI